MTNTNTNLYADFLVKPEEFEARDYSHALNEMHGREFYITQKHEGRTIVCYIWDDLFEAYDKNGKISTDDAVWDNVIREYNIEESIRHFFGTQKVAIYGVIAPNNDLYIHSVYYIEEKMYGAFVQLWTFCMESGLTMANLVDKGDKFSYSLDYLIGLARKLKFKAKPTAGIIIRSQWPLRSGILEKEWSLQIANDQYKKK